MNKIKKLYRIISDKIDRAIDFICSPFVNLYNKYLNSSDLRSRNRKILLFAFSLVMLDYLFICYHVDRSPFDLVPSLPHIDVRNEINVYVTDLDGKSVLKEKRLVDKGSSDKEFAYKLVSFVFAGSKFENTRLAVPVSGKVRNIWFYEGKCIIDLRTEIIKSDIEIIPSSEETFRKALSQTITENIPSVKEVIIAENGIPNRKLWETFVSSAETPKEETPAN
ncbi:MAG: hypothetical protein KAZ87_12015 [Spirochaetes bacterium]|nr:hypothetical protein [Spirochaetota bacterium]